MLARKGEAYWYFAAAQGELVPCSTSLCIVFRAAALIHTSTTRELFGVVVLLSRVGPWLVVSAVRDTPRFAHADFDCVVYHPEKCR